MVVLDNGKINGVINVRTENSFTATAPAINTNNPSLGANSVIEFILRIFLFVSAILFPRIP